MQKEKHLGNLSGKLLVFGGAYSNYQALLGLKNVADSLGIPPHRVICTGDLVGYCADPDLSVQLAKNWGIEAIAGNVEVNLREDAEACGCNFDEGSRCDLFSRQWYPYAQGQLSPASWDYLHALPLYLRFQYAGKEALVLHGAFEEISRFVFASTPWVQKARQFALGKAELILAGHSGLPFAQHMGDLHWINAGVIGMPANDGTPRVWYVLLDDSSGTLSYQYKSLDYGHAKAQNRMRQQPLPISYAQTLETGIWDNCEILPPLETAAQGIPLQAQQLIQSISPAGAGVSSLIHHPPKQP